MNILLGNDLLAVDDQGFVTLSNQTEYAVLSGESVSLLCARGFNLDTTIIWQPPTGTRIKVDDSRSYSVENGPDVVRLNIIAIDDSLYYKYNYTLICSRFLSNRIFKNLNYTAPPGQPLNLTAESASPNFVNIQWQAPNDVGSHGISYYNKTVYKIMPYNNATQRC